MSKNNVLLSTTRTAKETGIGCGVEPVLYRRRRLGVSGGGVSSAIRREADQICFGWQECGTNEKALRPQPEGLDTPQSVQRLARLGSRFRAGHWWCSASARLSLRTEFARTLQKTLNCSALAFLDLPFSRSYFELTSMPSTRT